MSTMTVVAGLIDAVLSGNVDAIAILELALSEGKVEGAPKGETFHVVTRKAWKRYGVTHPAKVEKGAFAIVNAKAGTIRIFGIKNPTASDPKYRTVYDRTFKVGETVEYDSYNLAYHGTIKSIGPSGTVAVEHRGSTTRLDLHTFSWRNYDLDLEANERRNWDCLMNT